MDGIEGQLIVSMEIEVQGKAVRKSATAPDWLSTHDMSSCVAVAVANDAVREAWLIHDPNVSQDSTDLAAMLSGALATAPQGGWPPDLAHGSMG